MKNLGAYFLEQLRRIKGWEWRVVNPESEEAYPDLLFPKSRLVITFSDVAVVRDPGSNVVSRFGLRLDCEANVYLENSDAVSETRKYSFLSGEKTLENWADSDGEAFDLSLARMAHEMASNVVNDFFVGSSLKLVPKFPNKFSRWGVQRVKTARPRIEWIVWDGQGAVDSMKFKVSKDSPTGLRSIDLGQQKKGPDLNILQSARFHSLITQ